MAAADERVDKVLLCTPDKDLAQCVEGDRIVQVDRRKGEFRDEDGVRAKLEYSYAMQQEIYEFERHSSLTCALALTETNSHCKDAQRKDRFYAMQQPQWFECVRTSKTNKLLLQDAVKEK